MDSNFRLAKVLAHDSGQMGKRGLGHSRSPKALALRFPLKAGAELQAQDKFRTFASAGADRSPAMQRQCGALQGYIGLLFDWRGDLDAHAGGRNVEASTVDEPVHTGAVLPTDLDL